MSFLSIDAAGGIVELVEHLSLDAGLINIMQLDLLLVGMIQTALAIPSLTFQQPLKVFTNYTLLALSHIQLGLLFNGQVLLDPVKLLLIDQKDLGHFTLVQLGLSDCELQVVTIHLVLLHRLTCQGTIPRHLIKLLLQGRELEMQDLILLYRLRVTLQQCRCLRLGLLALLK